MVCSSIQLSITSLSNTYIPSSALLPSPSLPIYIPGRNRMCSRHSRVRILSSVYSNMLLLSFSFAIIQCCFSIDLRSGLRGTPGPPVSARYGRPIGKIYQNSNGLRDGQLLTGVEKQNHDSQYDRQGWFWYFWRMTPSKDQDLLSAAADRPTCIQLRNFQVFRGGHPVTSTIDWDIDPGTFWAIVGKSGTGKTSLAQSLSGRYYYKGSRWIQPDLPIAFVEQQHHFRNRSNTSDFYYQQRFQSQDAEDALSIRELLEKNDSADTIKLLETFHLITSIDKPLIQLSNGENKRLQMVQALLGRPNLLILDNPFTGLDLDGRSLLHGLLKDLHQGGMTILLIPPAWEIPESCTHVLELGSNEVIYKGSRSDYRPAPITETHSIPEELLQGLHRLKETEFESAIRIRQGRVQYGENIILENLNWGVRKGDCWVISGPNGAGKST